ncbi:MAG TPA: phosphoenolpyruvate--protein phosphotransferase, partial [Chthoniobacterales bacterium]|nr:phosphoenolpyruvate--protein phosphotransferase [Chthoniobacterales bacterium]
SRALAEAAVDLIRRTVSPTLAIAAAGGVGETHSEIGTDAIDIQHGIESVVQPDGVLVLMDMGSAILSAEMAKDLLGDSINVRLCSGPLVEGGIAAAVQIQAGSTVDEVVAAARRSLLPKQDQLGEAVQIAEPALAPAFTEESFESVLENIYGLHLRPVAALVKALGTEAKNVQVENITGKRGPVVAASLVDIARLQGKKGDTIRFLLAGPNTARIRKEIESFLERLKHEDAHPVQTVAAKDGSAGLEPIAVSAGLAVGRVLFGGRLDLRIPGTRPNTPLEIDTEFRRLTEAIAAAQQNVAKRVAKFSASLNSVELAILEAQQLILSDQVLLTKAEERIRLKPMNAAAAWYETLTEIADDQAGAADDYLKQRAIDFREAASAVVQELIGQTNQFANLNEDHVLVCAELSPTLIDQIQSTRITGVIELAGGSLSHGAILARSIGLPVIANAARVEPALRSAQLVAIDGSTGQLLIDPAPEVVQEWRQKQTDTRELHERAVQLSQAPAVSADKIPFLVVANAGKRRDVELALANGADGIGLFRSEFLFGAFSTLPSEEDQLTAYRDALEPILLSTNANERQRTTTNDSKRTGPSEFTVTLRLLDIGGDKPLPFLSPGQENNPFLGVRGLRLLLRHPEFFESHLCAILRLAELFSIKLLVPMVTSVGEFSRLKQHLETAHQSLKARNLSHRWPIEIGAMIETPAAAVVFDQMIEHLDFASIGTNDLTQYVLSAERGNPALEEFADSLHPAVLRLCREVIALANQRRLPISICGEIASDPAAVPLLAGLGLRILSAAPTAVPTIKATVRALSVSEITPDKITRLLGYRSAAEIRKAL